TFRDLASILRTHHARGHAARALALREPRATQEVARPAGTLVHRRTALGTLVVRELRLLPITLQRTREGAGLRMVLARYVGAEKARLRHELATTLGAALRLHRGDVMRLRDERRIVHFGERRVERAPEVIQHLLPADGSLLNAIEL